MAILNGGGRLRKTWLQGRLELLQCLQVMMKQPYALLHLGKLYGNPQWGGLRKTWLQGRLELLQCLQVMMKQPSALLHLGKLHREIVPPRETVAIARVAIAIVGRGG